MLVAYGGCEAYFSPGKHAFHPDCLEAFLLRTMNSVQLTRHFLHEWKLLLNSIPLLRGAWEQGKISFQEDLHSAQGSLEEWEYFEQLDFAHDYACVNASHLYSEKKVLQAWFIQGYMLAWKTHFPSDEEGTS
jgi:hypothetical protein